MTSHGEDGATHGADRGRSKSSHVELSTDSDVDPPVTLMYLDCMFTHGEKNGRVTTTE